MLDFLYADSAVGEWNASAIQHRISLFHLTGANSFDDLLNRAGIHLQVSQSLTVRLWILLQQMLNGNRFNEDETGNHIRLCAEYLLSLHSAICRLFSLTQNTTQPVMTMFEFEQQLLTILERFNTYARSKSQQPTLFDGDSFMFDDLMEQTVADEKLVRHAIAHRWNNGQVLSERESMSWNNLQSRAKRQALTGKLVGGSSSTDPNTGISGNLTPGESQGRRVYGINGVNPTLPSRSEAGQNQQSIFQPAKETWVFQTGQTGGKGLGIYRATVMNTLDTSNSSAVAALDFNPSDARLRYASDDLAQTLTARAGTGGNQVPLVQTIAFVQNQRDEVRQTSVVGALQAQPGIKQQTFICRTGTGREATDSVNVAPTLIAEQQRNPCYIYPIDCQQVTAIIPDNAIGRPDSGTNGPMSYSGDDATPTLLSNGKVAAVACRSDGQSNTTDDMNIAATLTVHASSEQPYECPVENTTTNNGDKQFRDSQSVRSKRRTMGHQEKEACSSTIRAGLTIRRLTPLECERLQAFPDGYTDIPYRGKPHSPDSARYKALGNSMCVNVMRWIGQQIQSINNEPEVEVHQ